MNTKIGFASASLTSLIVVASLVLAGCSQGEAPRDASSTVIKAGEPAVVESGGVRVEVPEGAASAGSKLSLTVGGQPSALPPGLKALSAEADVHLAGPLQAPATVTFTVPRGLDSSVQPTIFWADGHGGWEALPTDWTSGSKTASAQAQHFSGGFLGSIDVKAIADDVKNFVVGRSGLRQPGCPNESKVRAAGIKVTSDSGDRVKWCLGRDDKGLLLKVGSDLRVFTQITYPSAWQVVDPGSFSFSTSSGIRSATDALGTLFPQNPGRVVRIIDGGDTLSLRIPEGSSGTVTAEMSIGAWALEGLLFGVQTFAKVAKVGGSAIANEASSRVKKLKRMLIDGETGDEYADAMFKCVKEVPGLSDARSTKSSVIGALEFGAKCGADYAKTAVKSTVGFLRAAVVESIATAVGAVLTACHLIFTGARELWDSVASFGGTDDVIYDIKVQAPSTTISGLDRGWNGVLPGQDLRAVAAKLQDGSAMVNDKRCPPAAMLYSQTDWPQIVATDGRTIDFVEVYDNRDQVGETPEGKPWASNANINGPGGLHVGQPVSRFQSITGASQVVKKFPGNRKYGFDPYWVLKVNDHLYFYVRADEQSRNVVTFGWAKSFASADGRGHTQGGCY